MCHRVRSIKSIKGIVKVIIYDATDLTTEPPLHLDPGARRLLERARKSLEGQENPLT